jgi:threonine/homoserine/homoserine lactone efflux protein
MFVMASVMLLVIPGPAVLYIVSRSLAQGRRAGLVSTLGVVTGTLVHVAAAAFGLSALLASSALAYATVKYAGAFYLVYLGLRKLFGQSSPLEEGPGGPRRLVRLFWDGVLVNVLNPKTALFFLAFLPQFVDLSRGAVASQVLFLGLLFACLGVVSDGAWALGAGTLGTWARGNPRFLRAERYVSGTVFLGLGLSAALAGPARK